MIKINLLPPNIFEARVIKKLVALFVVLAIIVAAGGIGYTMKINKDTEQVKLQADAAQQYTEQAKNWETQAANARQSIGPIETKRKFFEAVWAYNQVYPQLYEDVAKFTYAKVFYSQLQPNGTALQIAAYAPTLSDAGRYLLNLYRATHLFTSVTISAVPGYPSGGSQPGGGPPAMPGMPGIPGMPGMAPPPMSGIPGTAYGGLEAISTGLERAEKAPTGFAFTVACTLRNPITAPTYGTAPAAGAGGMPGGMPGM